MIRQVTIGLSLSLLFSFTAGAQDARLVEAAKQESGAIIAYGSLESNTVEPIVEAFKKKTGLTVEYWRASATKAMDRALSEFRAGKSVFDVMVNNSGAIHVMKKDGLFAKYISPAAKAFPKEVIDPQVGPVYRNTPVGIVYNKGQVSAADAPKSLEDLLSPRYKGKFVMPDPTQHTTTLQWLSSLYKIMGREKADKFIRDLGATKPLMVESFAPSAERVATGETPIAISLIRYTVTYADKGAPVDYVRLGKMLSTGQYLALSNKANRPNGGKAFIDFFLGDESMRILAKMGEFVNRKGIYPPLPGADKIQAVEMDDFDANQFKEKTQELQNILEIGDMPMASREYLKSDTRQRERAYSPAVKIAGGTTIYLAGHTGYQDDRGETYPDDFDGQVRVAFERMRKTLEAAGGKLDDIVTMTVFVTDMANGTRFTQLRKEFFQEGRYPASALIGIKELARPEMMIEIQAIAVVD